MASRVLDPDHTIPALLTVLVGRTGELTTIRQLLAREEVRLVTLTGPGGVGKTRLAIHVARETGDDFPDGAAFVDLAPVRDPELVVPTIAQALGIPDTGQSALLERIAIGLHDRRFLLVLDNVEQVIAAAPVIPQLLSLAPDLTILATSREVLRLTGEYEFSVPPLSLPSPDASDPAEIAEIDSVRLFLQRATSVQMDFGLTPANAATIAELCAKLDGLPLAIELAAARLRHLSPQALLARLSGRLTILTGGPRDLPARLQTMRDAIAWSHDLLPPSEQILFRRLAIFAGGFTPEGGEAVSGSGGQESIDLPAHPLTPSPAPLDGIASLVDKSLVTVVNGEDVEPRYGMLETIREYGLECLAGAGEEAATRSAHAAWCVEFAEGAAAVLTGPDRVLLLQRLDQELANLRQALTWAEETDATEIAYRLVVALAPFWEVQGYLHEGGEWARRTLAMPGAISPALRGAALRGAAALAYRRGRYEMALEGANAALEIAEPAGNDLLAAGAMIVLGNVAFDRGELEQSLSYYERALARYRAADDVDGIADSLSKAGLVLNGLGEIDRAAIVLEESVAIARQANRPIWVATSIARLALGDQRRGDIASAERRIAEALPIQLVLTPIQAVGSMWMAATVARDARNWPLAASRFRESLELRWKWGERRGVAESLAGIAELAVLTDRPEAAARLFGGHDTLRQAVGVPGYRWEQWRRDQAVARARQQLGGAAFATAFSTGQSMPRGEVVALALAVCRDLEQVTSVATTPAPAEPEIGAGLTARELEVLRYLADGLSDREIAAVLFISPRTVARHLHSIYQKLDVNSRSAATAYAHKQGLV